jgi:hypothetical protein
MEQSLTEIKNRRDFSEAFDIAMTGADQSLRSIWQFGKDQNLPKTYLVEFHPKVNDHFAERWTTEQLFLTLAQGGEQFGAMVRRTEDDSLLYLSHTEQSHSAEFIIDALNPRFLAFHTLSNAKSTDRFILERLTHHHTAFDSFWLPVSLLEGVEKREQVTGWEASFEPLMNGLDFSPDDHEDDGIDEVDSSFSEPLEALDDEVPSSIPHHPSLRINILRRNAMKAYNQLRSSKILPDVPLSSILAERYDNELDTKARARIKWNGKVTGRGTDFSAYLQIVNGTLDNYASVVTSLESKYWLGLWAPQHEKASGFRLKGEPFCITFESEINVESVVNGMFNCRPPFRLMGEPQKLSEKYYVIDAVDLHVGQPLAIEVSPCLIRVYLYEGTCGNTIVRILRSLQHYIDSNLWHPPLLTQNRSADDGVSKFSSTSSLKPEVTKIAEYRKRKGTDTWHWCSNCSSWPTGVDTDKQDGKPTSGELCNECQAKHFRGNCR